MTRYPSLGECLWLAAQVTGTEATVLAKAPGSTSALHAPAAGFGEEDFYPDLIEGRRVDVSPGVEPPASRRQQARRLGQPGHVLDLNDCSWEPDPPNVDEAEAAVHAVAAHDVDEGWFTGWLRDRVRVGRHRR